MRRVVALLFVATAACGLIGSTAGYAGTFCGTLDAATVFCDSFDTDASPWGSVDSGSQNPITLSIENGPKTSLASPPNVLHVIADGGAARANRLRHPFLSTDFPSGTAICGFDFEVLSVPNQPALIVWLEEETQNNGTPLYGGGASVSPNGDVSAGACMFQGDAGPQCLGNGGHKLDTGEWHHVEMTVMRTPDAGITSVQVQLDATTELVPFAVNTSIAPGNLALCVGLATEDVGVTGDVLLDNVFCR